MKPKPKKVIRGWMYSVDFDDWKIQKANGYTELTVCISRPSNPDYIPVEIRPVAAKKRKAKP